MFLENDYRKGGGGNIYCSRPDGEICTSRRDSRQSGEGKAGILIRFNYWMEFWRVVCRRGGKRVKGSRILEVVQTGGRRRDLEEEVGML